MGNTLKLGEHNFISDISGFKFKSGDMRKLQGTQKGLVCHKSEWNPPQPQLKVRGIPDRQNVPNPRVRPPDDFSPPPNPEDL